MRHDGDNSVEGESTVLSEDSGQEADSADVAEAGAQRLRALLGEVKGIDGLPTANFNSDVVLDNNAQEITDPNAEAYTFRLFASKPSAKSLEQDENKHTPGETKISLAANDWPSVDGNETLNGVLAKQRPQSYYVVEGDSYMPKLELDEAAIDGATVLKLSNPGIARPGMVKPWKVIHVQERAKKKTLDGSATVCGVGKAVGGLDKVKRCRKGKKTRIKIRMRMRALEAEREAQKGKSTKVSKQPVSMPVKPGTSTRSVSPPAASLARMDPSISKEQHLAEKKRKLNRKKQLKKREKAREEKRAHQPSVGDALPVET